jgi:hypothetical protein
MGKQKSNGKYSPPKNKLLQDSEGNEKNGYQVPDSNKTKIVLRNPTKPTRTI